MRNVNWKIERHEEKVSKPELWIFTKKELVWMIIAIPIATFISFIPIIPNDEPIKILTRLLIFCLIIFTSVIVKKLLAPRYSLKIEHRIWEFQRWGPYKRSRFKKPMPMGLIFPFFLGLFSLGYLKPFTFLQFDIEDDPDRRRLSQLGYTKHRRKQYMNQSDYGYVASWGFYTILLLAMIGGIISFQYNSGFGADLAKFSIYYGIWNLVPFGQLDGSRLFFGVFWGWIFLTLLYIIGLLFVVV